MSNQNFLTPKRSRHIFFLFIFSVVFDQTFASGLITIKPIDSAGPIVKEHKISKQQFLEKYGRDDSTRALIKFYFDIRKKSGRMIWVSFIALAAVIIISGIIVVASMPYDTAAIDDPVASVALVMFGAGLYATFVLALIGTIRTLMYSRKRLLRILKNYYSGQSLPLRITKSKSLLKFMDAERKKSRPQISPQFYLNE